MVLATKFGILADPQVPIEDTVDVVPIPGTKRRRYLHDNLGALHVALTGEDLGRLSQLRPAGDRYPHLSWVNGDTVAPGPATGPRAQRAR